MRRVSKGFIIVRSVSDSQGAENIDHHHPESKKRTSSEGNSCSIHPCGRYGNAGKTSKTISTIAILWPVKAIFEKRAAMVEVDAFISPDLTPFSNRSRSAAQRRLGVPKPGCFKPGCLQFLRGSALLRPFGLFCALLRPFALFCALLRTCVCALLLGLPCLQKCIVKFFGEI